MIIILFFTRSRMLTTPFFCNPFLNLSLISWFSIYGIFPPFGVIDCPAIKSTSSTFDMWHSDTICLCVFRPDQDFILYRQKIEIDFGHIGEAVPPETQQQWHQLWLSKTASTPAVATLPLNQHPWRQARLKWSFWLLGHGTLDGTQPPGPLSPASKNNGHSPRHQKSAQVYWRFTPLQHR